MGGWGPSGSYSYHRALRCPKEILGQKVVDRRSFPKPLRSLSVTRKHVCVNRTVESCTVLSVGGSSGGPV